MADKNELMQNVAPVFASDYVNHSPTEFSLTTMVSEGGEKKYAFTFIDHVVLPFVAVGADGEQQHGAKLERRFRSTVVIEDALWERIMEVVAELKKREKAHAGN